MSEPIRPWRLHKTLLCGATVGEAGTLYNRKTNRIPRTVFPHGLPQPPVGVPHNGADLPHEQGLPICRTCVSPMRKGRRSFNPITINDNQTVHTVPSPLYAGMGLSFSDDGGVHSPLPHLSPSLTAVLSPRRNVVTNGRVEVHPNLYARGDYARPCCARQRSLKRELL